MIKLRLRWINLLMDSRCCGYRPVVEWLGMGKSCKVQCGGVLFMVLTQHFMIPRSGLSHTITATLMHIPLSKHAQCFLSDSSVSRYLNMVLMQAYLCPT